MKVYIKDKATGKLFAGWQLDESGVERPKWVDHPLAGPWDFRIPTWGYISDDIYKVIGEIKEAIPGGRSADLLVVQEQEA